MSLTINLQTNYSDVNVLDKNISNVSSVSGVLKEQTSILNPIIKIQGSLPTGVNYMTIPDFGRSYFVTDIQSITNDIFEITGKVDVLTTYKNQIRGCTGIVSRQESNWNLFLDDGSFKVYQNEIIKLAVFESGFTLNQFVLAVAGA